MAGAETWEAWNIRLFQCLHATAESPAALVKVAACAAELPLYGALGLTLAWLVRRKDGRAAALVVFAMGVAVLLEYVVATVAFHPRPFAAGFGPAWVHHDPNNSMPSTHATLAWVMGLGTLLRHERVIAAVLLVLGCLMAWARIYVGIHWPADMVGAALAACLSVSLAWLILRAFGRITPSG